MIFSYIYTLDESFITSPIIIWSYMNKKEEIFIQKITELLSSKGLLSKLLPNFTVRDEQIEMAQISGRTFNNNEISVIQAGTGVGKSFAYLIPAILWAEENDETVIISTATTNLQDQLWQKDIPLLHGVFDFEFEAIVVKGAQQYICLDRLQEQSAQLPLTLHRKEQKQLAHIQAWAPGSNNGQKNELPFEPSLKLWREIEVSTTLCLRESCRYFTDCAFIRDRNRIPKAHIVITNHSLLMSDLALRTQSDGYASILPEYSRLVIDEAHKFESAVTDALSVTLNPITTRNLLLRIYNPDSDDGFLVKIRAYQKHLPTGQGERTSFSRAITKCEQSVSSAIQSMRFFFERIMPIVQNNIIPHPAYTVKQSYTNEWLQTEEITDIRDNELNNFSTMLEKISQELYGFQLRFAKLEESEELLRIKKEIQFFREQINQLIRGLEILFNEEEDDIRWIELPPSADIISFRSAPLSVDDFLGPLLFEQMKTIIFTSATLAPGKKFDFFRKSIGLDAFERERQTTTLLESPFPYEHNALLLVPTNIPDPSSMNYQQIVNTILPEAVAASKGRALILFTSHGMLRATYETTCSTIEELGYTCISQSESSRAIALEKFREDKGSVLFGTTSFWDGIDVVGESLSLVIIVRLPFSVPDDPIIEARSQQISDEGKNPFLEFQLPLAAMRLQQGFGRLIRTHTDRGIVFCLDKRLITKPYGEYIRESLPPCSFSKGTIAECINVISKFLT
jgi:ATP-dependent DNA helicase DinG